MWQSAEMKSYFIGVGLSKVHDGIRGYVRIFTFEAHRIISV